MLRTFRSVDSYMVGDQAKGFFVNNATKITVFFSAKYLRRSSFVHNSQCQTGIKDEQANGLLVKKTINAHKTLSVDSLVTAHPLPVRGVAFVWSNDLCSL